MHTNPDGTRKPTAPVRWPFGTKPAKSIDECCPAPPSVPSAREQREADQMLRQLAQDGRW